MGIPRDALAHFDASLCGLEWTNVQHLRASYLSTVSSAFFAGIRVPLSFVLTLCAAT